MKNLSTGTGLALLATAIIAYPIVNRISSVDQSAHASVPLAAIAAAATAQANPEPTVVWYTVTPRETDGNGQPFNTLWRAWSDGTVEALRVGVSTVGLCQTAGVGCLSAWLTVNSPTAGYRAAADLNADELVDGADLSSILGNWGDAPRVPFPPSDCPLNLINP